MTPFLWLPCETIGGIPYGAEHVKMERSVLDNKSISTGTPKFLAGRGADWAVLRASAGPSWKLGPSSHTGGPKASAPNCLIFFKSIIFINIQ
jgi:hypothetical protein